MRGLAAAFVAAALAGCGVGPNAPEPFESYGVALLGNWSPDEVEEATLAFAAWRGATDGRLQISLVPADEADAFIRARPVAGESYARLDLVSTSIQIDLARMRADGWSTASIGALVRNMIGQAVGIALHDEPGVMSRADVRRDFTRADFDAIAAAGWR